MGRGGVQFVGRGVVREWFGGGDGGDLGRGLPLCRFGWSAARAVARLMFSLKARLVIARAEVRMSCVLSRIRLTMAFGGSYVRRFKTLLNAVESVRFLRGWCLQLVESVCFRNLPV